MTIKQEKNADKLTLLIAGRIDTKTAPELEQVVTTELEGVTELVLDLAETSYISSAGRVSVPIRPGQLGISL